MSEKITTVPEAHGQHGYITSTSSHENLDIVCEVPPENRSCVSKVSEDLRRTGSNALSHVVSRITTRSLPQPSPPPDGGLKAVRTCLELIMLYERISFYLFFVGSGYYETQNEAS